MNDPQDSPTTGWHQNAAGRGQRAQVGRRWATIRRSPEVQALAMPLQAPPGPDVSLEFAKAYSRSENPGLAAKLVGGILGAVVAREIYNRTRR